MSSLAINSGYAAATCKAKAAGRAIWLVLGWLAFWLGTVVYPCQAHHAPPAIGDVPAAMTVSSSTNAYLDHADSPPAHQDGTCQELTTPAIAVPLAVAATGETPNPGPPISVAFDMKRLASAVHAVNTYRPAYPPPHTPLFLSTQRLLI